ncbi:MAG: phosphate/phosphite/phosphonate ABC transporter substrate-binding protein [Actinomycetota bacterium]|nr:phosphate/phosphite/phosphonate ABC transporter substrate-binding protein [Actinomycetota bacterium]
MASPAQTLVMGAVAYDPKVVTIWEGFKGWFESQGLAFDYVLYSNYDAQVEAMAAGQLHVAWNSPLAWLRAQRLARARGQDVRAVVMRDSDCDLTSVVVVRADGPVARVADLAGCRVAVGAADSPQATLIPLSHLRAQGLVAGTDFEVVGHEVGSGKHGDHVGGERDAARALVAGTVDAACMIDSNHLLFSHEGTLPPGSTRILTQTEPYDHCNFTVGPEAPPALVDRFTELLLAMSYDDPDVRTLLDLEGLKAWRTGRTTGYGALAAAVAEQGVYDDEGGLPGSS